MKTGILFDLDGTLLNTLEDLLDSTNYSLRAHGYPERTLPDLRRVVGNGARNQITKSLPQGAEVEPVLATYQAYYPDHCRIKTKPYEGILPQLELLKRKFPLAIVSNKPDKAVKALCADFFPGIYALGETEKIPRKPRPEMVHAAMEAIGADRCIYVGDSEVDILTAKNAGAPCLSVTWGFRDREDLEREGGQYYCHDPKDLEAALYLIMKKEQITNDE